MMHKFLCLVTVLLAFVATSVQAQVNVIGLRPIGIELDDLDATTGWAVVNDDAGNLVTALDHVEGTNSLDFDKLDGTANTTYGLIARTVSSVNVNNLGPAAILAIRYNLPSYTNVTGLIVRLGTDASNYNEFTCATSGTAGQWNECYIPLSIESATAVGNGWNTNDVDYFAIGAQFSTETDTLTAMLFDQTMLLSGMPASRLSRVDIDSITAGDNNIGNVDIVTFPDNEPVDVALIAGTAPSLNTGVRDAGTQRVTIATDDTVEIDTFPDNEPFDLAQIGGNAVSAGSGINGTGVQRITLATDDELNDDADTIAAGFATEGSALASGVLLQGDDGTDRTNVAVDTSGNVAVNVIGSVPAGTNNIGDVDVVSFPDNEPFNLSQVGGTMLSATAAVLLADDITIPTSQVVGSVLMCHDSVGGNLDFCDVADGGSGAATANTSRVIAATDSPDVTALQIIDNIVSGSEAQVDVIVFPDNEPFNVAQLAGTATSVNNGTADAGTLRVTVASDSTGVVSVDDNAGSLTIDGTVTADAGTGDFLTVIGHTTNEALKESGAIGGQLDDTATTAATENNVAPARITAQRAVHINLRAEDGSEIGTTASPVGMSITDGTDVALVQADGDLQVECSNCTGSGATHVDDAAFTNGTDDIAPMGAQYDTTPDAIDDGDAGIPRMDANRVLMVVNQANTGVDIGDVDILSIAAGDNNIGNVDVASALPAGDNNVGNVDIVTFPDNEPINVAQMNGVAVTMGNGVSGTGVQRVTLASDSTGQVALAASTANVGDVDLELAGTAVSGNNGAADAGTLRVAVASDSTIQIEASTNNIGDVDIVTFPDNEPFNMAQMGGTAIVAPRCLREEPSYISINQTAGAQLITGTASERIYICSFQIISATAQNVALVSGTGTVCATSPSGVVGFGGSTAATGYNLAANSGIALAGADNPYGETDTNADNVCLLQSASGQVSGGLTYVSQVQ